MSAVVQEGEASEGEESETSSEEEQEQQQSHRNQPQAAQTAAVSPLAAAPPSEWAGEDAKIAERDDILAMLRVSQDDAEARLVALRERDRQEKEEKELAEKSLSSADGEDGAIPSPQHAAGGDGLVGGFLSRFRTELQSFQHRGDVDSRAKDEKREPAVPESPLVRPLEARNAALRGAVGEHLALFFARSSASFDAVSLGTQESLGVAQEVSHDLSAACASLNAVAAAVPDVEAFALVILTEQS
jgi:hypothetical protein